MVAAKGKQNKKQNKKTIKKRNEAEIYREGPLAQAAAGSWLQEQLSVLSGQLPVQTKKPQVSPCG